MDTEETGALSYLNTIGPRSNLGKIGTALASLRGYCQARGNAKYGPADAWSEAEDALSNAEDICTADSGEDAEAKADAREELESAIEDLLSAIEAADEEPVPVTPAVTPGSADSVPAAWHPLSLLESHVTAKLGANEYRLQGFWRDALNELAALWREYSRGERPCPLCDSPPRPAAGPEYVAAHDGYGAGGRPAAAIRDWQARHESAARVAKLEAENGKLQHELDRLRATPGVARPVSTSVTPAVTERPCACGCGQPVTSPRPEAKYATGACRVRAHRAR